ncbi:MAG: hypothetical protein JNJ73_14575 [Hyphomonadaceae bacterium]|nr:hypothetical protein [Hyphomonadaceae bacterium]
MKTRLAGVLFLASLPGVVLGGLEAHRAYVSAAQIERRDVAQFAEQTANRIEEVISGARILTESLAQAPMVRIGSASCNAVLANAAAQSSRFEVISRLDRSGRVICSSDASSVGNVTQYPEWFERVLASNRPTIAPARMRAATNQQILPLAAPILDRDRTTGVVVLGLRAVWLISQAARDVSDDQVSVVLFDSAGIPFAVAARGLSQDDAVAAARDALSGEQRAFASVESATASIAGEGLRIVVVKPTQSTAIGFRAALVAAAPLIAVALAMAAVWIALHWWVIRWIDGLVESAQSVAAGRYAPVDVSGAPRELRVLGEAFDRAVTQAEARASELQQQLAANLALTREVHHRVKNNLQVLTSALSRQLRRTEEPTARYALSEARARLLPISLAYRYTSQPEDVTRVDLGAYLTELARQIHDTLDGLARGVELRIVSVTVHVSIETATALGTIVGECLTSAYLSSIGMSSAPMIMKLARGADGFVTLDCGVERINPSHDGARFDEPLVRQLARQVGAELTAHTGPRITLTWKATQEDEPAVPAPPADAAPPAAAAPPAPSGAPPSLAQPEPQLSTQFVAHTPGRPTQL